MDVNSKEAAEWSDLMRRNSELEAALTELLRVTVDPSVHGEEYEKGIEQAKRCLVRS